MSTSPPSAPLQAKPDTHGSTSGKLTFQTIRQFFGLIPRMESVLYIAATVIMILGALLILPAVSRFAQASDPIMLLAAPIAMNGIWLLVAGIIICALARVIQLLRVLHPLEALEAEGEAKIVIRCPSCSQRLRVDRGRRGMITCPNCNTNFQAQTIVP